MQTENQTSAGVQPGVILSSAARVVRTYKVGNIRGARPKLSGKFDVSFSTCMHSLKNVNISRRGLLVLELAIGAVVFSDFGSTGKNARLMLAEVYAKAGYDCSSKGAKDYNTVRRHIGAAAGLFEKLGVEVVVGWMEGKKENKLIQGVAHEVSKLGFNSLDDVFDFIGKVSNRTRPPSVAAVSPYDIEVGAGLRIHIPRSLGEAELIELAQKILVLADEVKLKELESGGERRIANVMVQDDRRVAHMH